MNTAQKLIAARVDFEEFCGDTFVETICITDECDQPVNITGWQFPLVLKVPSLLGMPDATAVPPNGYATLGTILDAVNGRAMVTIPKESSILMTAGQYQYSIGSFDTAGNARTYQYGNFTYKLNPRQSI